MKPKTKKTSKDTVDLNKVFLQNFPLHSRFSESYRTMRTNIQFSFMDKPFRSLLVTSAGEKEGKTTTVANIAFTMAQAGRSVLMVDADLRKPVLSRIKATGNNTGLTGLLSVAFGADVSSGSLAEYSVSDLFWLISFQKKTGELALQQGEERINIYFQDGDLVDVSWLSRPKEKKLAALLVKNKVVTRAQAEEAMLRKRNTGQKLGFVLINMGLIKEDDLSGYITIHMIEGLRAALQLRAGTFAFQPLPDAHFDRPSFDPADLPQLYKQVILGEEELPFLQSRIQAAIRRTDVDNLFILPSGPRPPKPSELLESNRMAFLLSFLRRRYDVLVLDSPPVLPAADALLLAPRTDGVVLVVKAGLLNREGVQKAVDQIRLAQANLIGVVLNQVDTKREGYYKYYHKYYSRYYGESR